MFWPLTLFAITGVFFVAPLLPALFEWRRKTDAVPLRIYRKDEGNIRHFANTFRQFVRDNMQAALAESAARGEPRDGLTNGGLGYHIVGAEGRPALTEEDLLHKKYGRILLSPCPLLLPGGLMYQGDIYGENTISGEGAAVYRAVLAAGDIRLADGSVVLRWMHSDRSIYLGDGCTMYGRTSADDTIALGNFCRFQRLHARRIEFGPQRAAHRPEPTPDGSAETPAMLLPGGQDASGTRWLISGDAELPPRTVFDGAVVAGGDIRIGAGARIAGSLKSNRNLHLDRDVIVEGAVVSAGNIRIASGCRIRGPVVAERGIVLHGGTAVGLEHLPTSVTALTILVNRGVVVYGTVWARENGRVRPFNLSEDPDSDIHDESDPD